MRQSILVLSILLISAITQACTSKEAPVAEAQSPETQEAATKMSAVPSPDLVIDPRQAQRQGSVTIKLGQIIAITPPTEPKQWRITYAESVVELLTPKEILEDTGLKEWIFRALAVGSTDIQLTSITPACTDPLPCPQAPPQVITFTLVVK